ncbi:uncharacterized protein TNCV_56591 [Trichonephila clavipes]|nr:uncharacterized protein TNCV_56591 [Trichonephila clavipes]
MKESNYEDLWILSNNRSSVQHLQHFAHIGEKISLSILRKDRLISYHHKVHFRWVLSHVNTYGKELADTLANQGLNHPVSFPLELTHLELFSREKAQNKEND